MANLIKYIPSQSSELSLQWVADEFTRISSVLNEGLTIEDEGVALETSADTLNFVGDGVTATGNGSEKTITISGGGGGGSDLTVKDEGSALATAATTLDFVGDGVTASGAGAEKTITISGGGVSDHGALTGLADDDHTQYLHKDTTRNVTVGYTTDVEADAFGASVTPDLNLEHFKTMTVTSDFTLNVPTGGNGHCEYYLTIDASGPYTLTEGANLKMIDGAVRMFASRNYILNIHRYSSTNAVAQLLLIPS